jgi:predicted DNA-binding ribbon-helix-helix protein
MLTLVINERKRAEDVVSFIRVACADGLALMS